MTVHPSDSGPELKALIIHPARVNWQTISRLQQLQNISMNTAGGFLAFSYRFCSEINVLPRCSERYFCNTLAQSKGIMFSNGLRQTFLIFRFIQRKGIQFGVAFELNGSKPYICPYVSDGAAHFMRAVFPECFLVIFPSASMLSESRRKYSSV